MINWASLLMTLIPELVRGVIGICRDKYAKEKAEEERKKAEAEAKEAEAQKPQ
jgi:hypothetical protein